MKSFRETIYWHREKHENWEIEDKAKELGFNTKRIPYYGYEVKMEIEVFEDGTNKLISIMGVNVEDKGIHI